MDYATIGVDHVGGCCDDDINEMAGAAPSPPSAKTEVPRHVQDAIRTLLRWAGDDPDREGLLDTPARVGRAWLEYCICGDHLKPDFFSSLITFCAGFPSKNIFKRSSV